MQLEWKYGNRLQWYRDGGIGETRDFGCENNKDWMSIVM